MEDSERAAKALAAATLKAASFKAMFPSSTDSLSEKAIVAIWMDGRCYGIEELRDVWKETLDGPKQTL